MTLLRTILTIFAVLLTGCQSPPHPEGSATTVFAANVMTIDYRIIIGDPLSPDEHQKAAGIIQQTFANIDKTYNKWNPDSEISHLNQLKANQHSSLSPKLEHFLKLTQQIVALSENRFDPTIEPLQKLWKEKLSKGSSPTELEINHLMPAIGWDKIHFSNGSFYKDHDLTSIDLGGIAKGLCVDMLIERLNDAGFQDVFVEWGGEIRASGRHPDNRLWNIFIARFNDADPEHAIAHVSLKDQAIATSGDYLQNWTVREGNEEVTYFHILDPKTGKQLISRPSSIASASILAPTCALADGLATVAMMFPSVEEASNWLEGVKQQYPTIEFWLVTHNEQPYN